MPRSPADLFIGCPSCGEVIHKLVLAENQRVCPKCDYHFSHPRARTLRHLLDPESFRGNRCRTRARGHPPIPRRRQLQRPARTYQQKTGLKDSVISGFGRIEGREVSIRASWILSFWAAAWVRSPAKRSRGHRARHRGRAAGRSSSRPRAARGFYEGMFSLMQMAKTSGALAGTRRRGCRSFPCSPIRRPAGLRPASRPWAT